MKKLLTVAFFTAVVFTLGQIPFANSLSAAEPKAGERKVVKIKGVDFAFRYCPAGTFMMGSPKNEKNRYDNEPQHEVQLTQGFWLGETEITQEQWGEFMKDNPSHFKGRKLPVESVSWNACQKYIEQLNDNAPEGYKFALPTEAQWEYACRAGSKVAYCFGDNDKQLGDYAWYDENSDGKTHEVGGKKANAWGLYDMHGNVAEWTDSASSGVSRVYRGGNWICYAGYCRSACRNADAPGDSLICLGLRVALVPSK